MTSKRVAFGAGRAFLLLVAIGLVASTAFAKEETPPPTEERERAKAEAPTPTDPRIGLLRALMSGSLDVAVEPRSLFSIPLDDEREIEIEVLRLETLLAAIAARAAAAPGGEAQEDGQIDHALWEARVALDRARLEFLSLENARRLELLELHAARQDAARPRETEEERRARELEKERQRLLEAARIARTEAERLVGEELTRQLELEKEVEASRERFGEERDELKRRWDTVLGWQRRVREAKAASPEEADATYDALRRTLFVALEEASAALAQLRSERSQIPPLGPDPLVDVPPDVSTASYYEGRASLSRAIVEVRKEEAKLRDARTSALLDEIELLNRQRLGLLPHLSAEKRGAITGLSSTGWEQARAEVRHLFLVIGYHHHVVRSWVSSLLTGGPTGLSPLATAAIAIPWALLAWAFVWGRRRTPRLLQLIEVRMAENDRAERRTTASPQRRAASFARKVHRPLEWLIFFAGTMWLIPKSSRALLEVQLFSSVTGWVIGGTLAVNVTDAIAAGPAAAFLNREDKVGTIRLRSLRLVGWTFVSFALLLALSTQLVGRGTIYGWVFTLSWFAAVPVFLVLVRWWRETVFERIERVRKKTRLQEWILANRSGWQSFLAAMIGAVQLFSVGVVKVVRSRISGFDLTRRAHAYLFRRELDRFADDREVVALRPLAPEVLEALHPAREYERWLPSPNDELLARLGGAANQGGVFAVVGPMGSGKSSLLRRLAEEVDGAVQLRCSAATLVEELRSVCSGREDQRVLGAESRGEAGEGGAGRPERSSSDGGGLEHDGQVVPRLILLDDAQALLKPVIGGLATFDEFISFARSNCSQTAWVFALDTALWPFLSRARDASPLFDETHWLQPWDEQQIGALLVARNREAGIEPTYDDLLDRLPRGADDLDRLDALAEKKAGYERMLWDHVRGNPGLALEAWRSSLGEDGAKQIHVRPLQLPDPSKLEFLPDSSLFILRAVLQLAPASLEDIAQVTRLSPEQVRNAFRFGVKEGIFADGGELVSVSWRWRRAVLRLLERRRLLEAA